MADSVGIAEVGTGDRGAALVRDFADLPGGRLVALRHDDPRRLERPAARRPAAGAMVPLEGPAASQAPLEQRGTPVRLAPAGQEAS
jgi:hypothetical protein